MEYSIYKFLNISTAVLYGEVTTVSNRFDLFQFDYNFMTKGYSDLNLDIKSIR